MTQPTDADFQADRLYRQFVEMGIPEDAARSIRLPAVRRAIEEAAEQEEYRTSARVYVKAARHRTPGHLYAVNGERQVFDCRLVSAEETPAPEGSEDGPTVSVKESYNERPVTDPAATRNVLAAFDQMPPFELHAALTYPAAHRRDAVRWARARVESETRGALRERQNRWRERWRGRPKKKTPGPFAPGSLAPPFPKYKGYKRS